MRDKSNENAMNKAKTKELWNNFETIDMRKMASTDLPFNSRVYLPEALDDKKEIDMHRLKEKLQVITDEYKRNNKTIKRNLTKDQLSGIRKLKKRREEDEIVIYQTDKSARMAVDNTKNYIECMATHIEGDQVIGEKDNKEIEKLINAHAVCWLRFMQAGELTGDKFRIKMSMQSKNNDASCLYSLRKDHKVSLHKEEVHPDGTVTTSEQGPPLRPVCDISDGISHRLSYLLSHILEGVCSGETVCNSTEEMLAAIEKCNNSGIDEDDVLGSADVKALYPSIPVEDAVVIVAEEFQKKQIKIEGIDYEELGLYIALNLDEEEIKKCKLDEVCPKRARIGRKPEITSSGIKVSKHERFEPWIRAVRKPNETEEIIMFKEGMKIGLLVVMKNHTYEFAKTIRKQKEGGPIGMDLTGTIAKIFMKWWDTKLLEKMEEVGLTNKMYERYIDDINKCMKQTPPGIRYENGRLVNSEETETLDKDKPADKRTMEVISQIANSIHPNIQVEIDVPSNYRDNKMPILDLKVWLEKVATNQGEKMKILHKHYIKPMANKYVINKKAAMSSRCKRTILTQMCLRVLLNNSEYLKKEEKKETVEFFLMRMQASGYDERDRYEVLKSAINAYNKIKDNSIRPKYRGKEMNTAKRRIEKCEKQRNWYKEGGFESVIFVPATPKSELARRFQEEVENSELKIKVVEKPGIKIKRILQRNDTSKRRICGDGRCFVCTTTQDGNCRKTGITYAIRCNGDCGGSTYYGETNGNAYTRGLEHINDYEHERTNSVMMKHCRKKHEGERQQFEMRVTDYVRKDPTKRQIMEAIRINREVEDKRINDRREWIVGKIPTVTIGNM